MTGTVDNAGGVDLSKGYSPHEFQPASVSSGDPFADELPPAPEGEARKVVIIGSGAAGWTAAIYAARAGLKPVVVAGLQPGGQLTITDDVENYPGFDDPIGGPELMARMERQALRYGAEVEYDVVDAVDLSARPYLVVADGGKRWLADAVIVATGATAKWLGVEGEDEYRGRGVSACATCDGFFFRGKEVAVVGGGNTAVEEALYLANLCSKVHLVHRRDTLKAERILVDRLLANPKVEIHWDRRLTAIRGAAGPMGKVSHVEMASTSGREPSVLEVSGVFAAIGHEPATGPFIGQLETDAHGYLAVEPGTTRTGVPFVHAAGDVADPHWRQAVTAAGMGCMAALDVERSLAAEAG